MKRLALALIVFILAMPFLVWHVVISEEAIVNLLRGLAGNGPIDVRFEGLKKGMFFSVTSEKSQLVYRKTNELILTIDNLRLSINTISVFTFRPTVQLRAYIKDGLVNGSVRLTGQRALHLNGRDVELSDLRGLSFLGLSGNGMVIFEVEHVQGTNNFRFRISNAKLSPLVRGAVTIPLNLFHTLRGTGSVVGDKVDIKSIAMEGNGINALIKGVLTKDSSDINLEIMTHSGFEQLPLLEGLLGRFKRSPGYYVVPYR